MPSSLSVRVFDTILRERGADRTTRNSADFWRPFCAASNWEFNYERIHSLDDVNFFFSRPIREDIIIFSGHGSDSRGFHLSNGDIIDGTNQFTIHQKNFDKTIILSSCSIGADAQLSTNIKNSLRAQNLFAYQHEMEDRFCFLFESMLLTLIDHRFERHASFGKVQFDEFKASTDFLKNINKPYAREHPLLFFE
jgi:hypothetical protein